MKPTRLALLCVLSMVALAVPGQAADEGLRVSSLDYEGGSESAGRLSMFYFADGYAESDAIVPGGNPPSPSTPWIDLRAARATAWTFASTMLVGPAGNQLYVVDEPHGDDEALTHLDLQLTGFDAGFQVHIFTLDGTVLFATNAGAGTITSTDGAVMCPGEWGENQCVEGASSEPVANNPPDFARVEAGGPMLSHVASAAGFTLTVTGDFVLEFYRVTLAGSATEGEREFSTGLYTRPLAPGLPTATEDAAGYQDRRFARLLLEDATIEVAAKSGLPRVAWAATELSAENSGAVTLNGVFGTMVRPNGEKVEHRGGQVILPAGSRFDLQPGSGNMALAFDDERAETQATIVDLASPQSATLVGTGAILALAAAVGVGLLRRWNTAPALADVERSIEAGHFRRAARLAKRILRRNPGFEDAVLARAIALAKSGRNERAARELSDHLAVSGASDGSLHYVLGLACMDLGRDDEGRAALREAVRLTPSLAVEVASRLEPGAPAAPLPAIQSPLVLKEANGYA